MSRSSASDMRMPASSPSATTSTSRSSTRKSTSTRGWSRRKRVRMGVTTGVTATVGTVRRTEPDTSPGRAVAVFRASSACSTGGPADSSRRRPASVRDTLRVVRVSNTTPSRVSNWRTDWLSADADTPSSEAAAAKLRLRPTTRKAFRALSGVKAIVKIS
uniref:Uncharacterized protein n=1 Tax=Myxococcus xanthus TaxID=34 RepID=Q8KRC4_MYXXA|nr:unknown [Myxococcus xanthus DZF1]